MAAPRRRRLIALALFQVLNVESAQCKAAQAASIAAVAAWRDRPPGRTANETTVPITFSAWRMNGVLVIMALAT